MLYVILQASISFAQMSHRRPVFPLDSVKALAVYSRSEGCCYFLMVELFSCDSCFSIQWIKQVTEGWLVAFFFFF